MNIFYAPDALLSETCELDETESGHIVNVLRKKESEELYLFDGKGNLFSGRIVSISRKVVTVHITRLLETNDATKPKLHIAIAPPKNIERFEWFLEKVIEIGISEITPVLCARSERKEIRADRLQRIMISAAKQSLTYTLPKLNPAVKFAELNSAIPANYRKYIAHADDRSLHLKDAYHGGFDAVVLIGPEGDFTPDEISMATQQEFETVSLGKSRLRLETAGVYAAVVFNLANE